MVRVHFLLALSLLENKNHVFFLLSFLSYHYPVIECNCPWNWIRCVFYVESLASEQEGSSKHHSPAIGDSFPLILFLFFPPPSSVWGEGRVNLIGQKEILIESNLTAFWAMETPWQCPPMPPMLVRPKFGTSEQLQLRWRKWIQRLLMNHESKPSAQPSCPGCSLIGHWGPANKNWGKLKFSVCPQVWVHGSLGVSCGQWDEDQKWSWEFSVPWFQYLLIPLKLTLIPNSIVFLIVE